MFVLMLAGGGCLVVLLLVIGGGLVAYFATRPAQSDDSRQDSTQIALLLGIGIAAVLLVILLIGAVFVLRLLAW
jgi:hypothetical protein